MTIETSYRPDEPCVHCGACVGLCPSLARVVDETTRLVIFRVELCVACGLCDLSCGYGALERPAARPLVAKEAV